MRGKKARNHFYFWKHVEESKVHFRPAAPALKRKLFPTILKNGCLSLSLSLPGVREAQAKRMQRRANVNNALGNSMAAAGGASSNGAAAPASVAVVSGGGGARNVSPAPNHRRQGGGGGSKSEANLAFVLIGIVIMHMACHLLRVFLAGVAVYLINDTVYCMSNHGGYVPPLWTMCAECISSLLIMINFSGNFLIYCSILKPFKDAFNSCCRWWKGAGGGSSDRDSADRATTE